LGRLAICRIYEGQVRKNDEVYIKGLLREPRKAKIIKIMNFYGMERRETEAANAGDVVILAGIADINIGETICAQADQEPLPIIKIDEPTISLNF